MEYEDVKRICRYINSDEDDEKISDETIADWYSYCREVTIDALDRLYDKTGMIGGEGHIVEIDETKIGKRKYNRGRMVEGSWIFGMIDITTKNEADYRLEICEDNRRNEENLLKYIKKHIKPGTTIYSDCWSAYVNLEQHGYKHYTVNHSVESVSSWRDLKRKLHGTHKDQLGEYLCAYLWRRECRKRGKDAFEELIDNISVLIKIKKKKL